MLQRLVRLLFSPRLEDDFSENFEGSPARRVDSRSSSRCARVRLRVFFFLQGRIVAREEKVEQGGERRRRSWRSGSTV